MLDPTKPVYIKKEIRDRVTGNSYPADATRPYNLLTFPETFRTEEFFTHDAKVAINPLINPSLQSIAPSSLVPSLDPSPPPPLINEAPIPHPVMPTPVITEAPTVTTTVTPSSKK